MHNKVLFDAAEEYELKLLSLMTIALLPAEVFQISTRHKTNNHTAIAEQYCRW
jgi:hypothetical protein